MRVRVNLLPLLVLESEGEAPLPIPEPQSTVVTVTCEHCGYKMKMVCDKGRAGSFSEPIVCLNPECKHEITVILPGAFLKGPFPE